MRYERVRIASVGYTLPEEVVTTAQLEERLGPLYQRLRLPEGRLELMTGIAERRFFARGVLPGTVSRATGQRAIEASGLKPAQVGALVHGSVCRDFLEPATACGVHHALGLPGECVVYDVSNACLGMLNGMLQIANLIELGQIEAGIVVGTESGRGLVENTVEQLNGNTSLTRASCKSAMASLTIGSASAAIVLCTDRLAPNAARFHAATAGCDTSYHDLCQSEGLVERMHTDSEGLLQAGVATGRRTFDRFLQDAGWTRDQIDRTVCHQVGVAHQRLMFEALELDRQIDFTTFERLGNTGSAALPVTLGMAAEQGRLTAGSRVALLGIGSGINCVMLAVEWGECPVAGGVLAG